MRISIFALTLLLPGFAHADVTAGGGCNTVTPVAQANTLSLPPVAGGLEPASSALGATGAVLAQAYNSSQSVDQVLLRLRLSSCGNIANAIQPASPVAPTASNPAAYQPQTQWDNTPWRFNMTQNGRRMTADEFDAWMKARGVRVVGRKPATEPQTPPADPPKDN